MLKEFKSTTSMLINKINEKDTYIEPDLIKESNTFKDQIAII